MISRIRQRAVFFAVCSLGLACWWPFFRNSYLGMVFHDAVSGISNSAFLGVVAFGVGLFAILCSVVPWSRKRADAFMGGVSCLAAFAVLVLLRIDGSVFASAALALCVAFAAAASASGWFFVLCRIPWSFSVAVLSVSFFLSFCLPYIAHFYGEAAMSALNGVLMPISALCLCVAFVLPSSYRTFPEEEKDAKSVSDMKEMAIVLILFLVVGGVFRGCFGQGSLDYSPAAEGEFRYAIALVLSAALIAFTLAFSRQPAFFVVVWAVLAFAFLAGLVFLSAFARPADEIWSSIVITARTFMALLLWMVAVGFCRERDLQTQARCAAMLLLGVETLCLLLTAFVSPFVNEILGGYDPAIVSCVMALVLVAWSFAYLITLVVRGSFEMSRRQSGVSSIVDGSECDSFVLLEQDGLDGCCEKEGGVQQGHFEDALSGGFSQDVVDGRKVACSLLAARHDVTEREEEVLYQLSLGHSVKKIADTLFISSGTVQSHVKRIYRKLDCHSRQEVIDLVDEEVRARDAR